MAKLKPNEKRVQLSFQRPDDLMLYAFLEKRAYERRYDMGTFILLSLHEAFEGQVEAGETFPGLSGSPINREPFRPTPAENPPAIMVPVVSEPIPALTQPESTDDGYESTKAAIAANNALYAKQRKSRKGVIPGADIVLENPPESPL